ncbi:putative familial paroxysmal dyskinesia fpd1 [Erysiphe neolycopersici]|uniref:Putative familial paroxysmal dyskinesia fpd1 n=1 Tax=Erysiphe neolycopersici TaxID=212602 RepID=A0A420I2E2_9PEZI|nr:putative familial paroxysmal dyskinesia fpd1 [Erysiphe neolycopersici]
MPPQVSRGVFMNNLSSQLRKLRNSYQVCSRSSNFAWSETHIPFARRYRDPAAHNIFPVSTKSLTELKTQRAQLIRNLKELNKHASSYINQSRLQLALRGLEQKCGEETIRIAVLCIPGEKTSFHRAKQIMRLLLADPLKPRESWEQILLSQSSQAILLRLDPENSPGTLSDNNLVQELHISSSLLNGHRAEILIMESDIPSDRWKEENSIDTFLVPSIKIPSSGTGRYNIVRTPVHRTLLTSEGILGLINILKLSMNFNHQDTVGTTIDLNVSDDHKSSVPCQFINVDLANKALECVRQNSSYLPEYETSWPLSGLPKIQSWLQQGIISVNAGMKLYLQRLIESLLENTSKAIEDDQRRLIAEENSRKVSQDDIAKLHKELRNWAFRSHCELQDNLELAFKGQRWRRLSWWKLFWRVDDISLIASDILNESFLINAEQEAIFLAGRIEERGMINRQIQAPSESHVFERINMKVSNARLGDEPAPPKLKDIISSCADKSISQSNNQSWPPHISDARLYLSHLTIPSLQALGQKLVIQTLCTSSLSTMLSGLIFISSVSLDLYEVGVIATIGILFSLRKMQRSWEKARDNWEGEVREEGRIALRTVEDIFNTFLTIKPSVPEFEEIKKAKAALLAAEKALLACKLK